MRKTAIVAVLLLLYSAAAFSQNTDFVQPQSQKEVVMKKKKLRQKSERVSGWEQRIDFGWASDYDDLTTFNIDADYVFGRQFGSALFIGAGAGIQVQPVLRDWYSDEKYSIKNPFAVSIPAFLDMRFYIMNRRFSPFIAVRGGYSLGVLSSKSSYDQQWTYDPAHDVSGLSSRQDTYVKRWSSEGKFGAAGIGISYKRWDWSAYMPFQYGMFKYRTDIEWRYNDSRTDSKTITGSEKNHKWPYVFQLRAAYRF